MRKKRAELLTHKQFVVIGFETVHTAEMIADANGDNFGGMQLGMWLFGLSYQVRLCMVLKIFQEIMHINEDLYYCLQ